MNANLERRTFRPGRVYIGITGEKLLANKKFAELLQSYDDRAAAAADYVRRVRPDVAVQTGELTDPMVSGRLALASAPQPLLAVPCGATVQHEVSIAMSFLVSPLVQLCLRNLPCAEHEDLQHGQRMGIYLLRRAWRPR